MKPSLWTSIFVERSPEDALRALRKLGWRCFELSCEHLAVISESANRSARIKRFRRLCDELGVSVPQCHLPLQTNLARRNTWEVHRELNQTLEWMETAAALGVKVGVIHPGTDDGPVTAAAWKRSLTRNVASFGRLVVKAEELGFRVALENMMDSRRRRHFGAVVSELHELIDRLDSPAVGICLDTSHAHAQGLDVAAAVNDCGRRLIATHISDNDGSGDQHKLPGHGTLDWPAVMAAAREIGYKGVWNLEIPGERGGPEPWLTARIKYALHVTKEMLKPSFAHRADSD